MIGSIKGPARYSEITPRYKPIDVLSKSYLIISEITSILFLFLFYMELFHFVLKTFLYCPIPNYWDNILRSKVIVNRLRFIYKLYLSIYMLFYRLKQYNNIP